MNIHKSDGLSPVATDTILYCSGSDGLVKLWTIKNNECVRTLDEHEDKIWALAVSSCEETVVTGAADSNIIVWKVGPALSYPLTLAIYIHLHDVKYCTGMTDKDV